ncbi:phosphatase PAP2 family protein [Nonomuraea sp. NPDC050394]|uniref:phosphatase PAP2 family protein n=1 Tax=Nonomuraea sp. NPDC050394 TaxID=3364363 RepID=UPI00378D84D7
MDILDGLRGAELGPIIALQGLPGWLEPVMEAVSLFGSEQTFLFLLPVLYWCVSPRLGLRMGVVVLGAAAGNAVLKLLFHAPRPYWVDARVRPLSLEGTFGLPSGHAQIATATWGALAAAVRRPWAWWGAVAAVALIGLSRVYLGVHFISDVVAGVLLGAAVLVLVVKLEEPAVRWWRGLSLARQLAASALVSVLPLGAAALASLPHAGWSPPTAWRAAGDVDPAALDTLVAMCGSVLGMLAGASVMYRLGWFSVRGTPGRKAARWALGSVVVGAVWFGLRELLPDHDVLRYLRYALLTLWVQLGAPLTFIRLGLMDGAGRKVS